MSYDTSILLDPCDHCGRHADVVSLGNTTSNVGAMYRAAMPGPYPGGGRYDGTGDPDPGGGLRGLSGLRCSDALPILRAGLAAMAEREEEMRAGAVERVGLLRGRRRLPRQHRGRVRGEPPWHPRRELVATRPSPRPRSEGMTMPRTPTEIRADLDAAKARHAAIGKEIATLDAKRKALLVESDALLAPWSKSGTLNRLEDELATALRIEADATLPRVRVGNSTGEVVHVVTRVTPKRIYTRKPGEAGEAGETIWTREGMPERRSSWDSRRILDVENATTTPTPPTET